MRWGGGGMTKESSFHCQWSTFASRKIISKTLEFMAVVEAWGEETKKLDDKHDYFDGHPVTQTLPSHDGGVSQ